MSTTRVLVAYATKHGSTREVAEAVAETLRHRGLAVDVMPAADVSHLRRYDGVVLGGALYMGRLHKDARRFLKRHEDGLAVRSLAVFAMGPRTLHDADVASSRAQLDHALAAMPRLAPVSVAIFGGVVAPEALGFPFNRMPAADARDWAAIEAWAAEVAERFARTPASATLRGPRAAGSLARAVSADRASAAPRVGLGHERHERTAAGSAAI
jgi:menaquinone-dependent protoporphyrinogen oxidase